MTTTKEVNKKIKQNVTQNMCLYSCWMKQGRKQRKEQNGNCDRMRVSHVRLNASYFIVISLYCHRNLAPLLIMQAQ